MFTNFEMCVPLRTIDVIIQYTEQFGNKLKKVFFTGEVFFVVL